MKFKLIFMFFKSKNAYKILSNLQNEKSLVNLLISCRPLTKIEVVGLKDHHKRNFIYSGRKTCFPHMKWITLYKLKWNTCYNAKFILDNDFWFSERKVIMNNKEYETLRINFFKQKKYLKKPWNSKVGRWIVPIQKKWKLYEFIKK